MNKTARRLIAHLRGNPVMWISLAVFVVLSWQLTGTSCVLRSITGLPCPGCGLTRALLAALHGGLAAAWQLHPLFWLAPLILLAVLILLVFRPDLLGTSRINKIGLTLAFIFMTVYIARMVLLFPHVEPMTYNARSLFGRAWSLLQLIMHN